MKKFIFYNITEIISILSPIIGIILIFVCKVNIFSLGIIICLIVVLPTFIEKYKAMTEKDVFISLCMEAAVYTAKYCGNDNLDSSTKDKISSFIKYIEPKKYSKRLTELEKLCAADIEISSSDIILLCKKIGLINTYRYKRKQILNILFSAVYQQKKFNPILYDIATALMIEADIMNKLVKDYNKKYYSNTKYQYQRQKQSENSKYKKSESDSVVFGLTLQLLVEAMKVDRSKMVCELDVIKAFIMKYDKMHFKERVDEVKQHIKNQDVFDIDKTCKKIFYQYRMKLAKREEILRILIDVIYADDTCTDEEFEFLKEVAEKINVSQGIIDEIMRNKRKKRRQKKRKEKNKNSNKDYNKNGQSQYQSNSQPKYTSELEKAYAALGIDRDATDKEVSACWRNLMRVNHPDLMESRGPEAVKKATEKCQELNKAFEIVKESRGMK